MGLKQLTSLLTGAFFILSYVVLPTQTLAVVTASSVYNYNPGLSKIVLPQQLGSIEESYQGSAGKTIIYLQDAHDSLDAQENIAKIIHHLVENYGVKTVFEEGYEGKVPTDEYFNFTKDAELKEKVSYFLMDKLRLGGAEYAHINRKQDFKLIGADSYQLHLQNIEWYRESARNKQQTEGDLKTLQHEVSKLANKYFPNELKSWVKNKKRYDNSQLDIINYLNRIKISDLSRYPNIELILTASNTKDEEITAKIKEIEPKSLFQEIDRLENDFLRNHLKDERDIQIFEYYKHLLLLRRLNDIEVTFAEYEASRKTLERFDTKKLVDFLAQNTKESFVLSKQWEGNLNYAIQFYEVAERRDHAIDTQIERFLNDSEEKIAILVFGGFHKSNIREILRNKDISYQIVSPKIDEISKRHQQYYKQLMSVGYYEEEVPKQLTRASVPQRVVSRIPNVVFVPYLINFLPDDLALQVRSETRSQNPNDPVQLRTFFDYATTSLGRSIESLQETELMLMWELYSTELDRAFAGASDYQSAYREFYELYFSHLTLDPIDPRTVRSYVPIVRKPFSSIEEIKSILDVDTEWSIDIFPEPDQWRGPSPYSFILSVVDGQLHMSSYDDGGLINEFNTEVQTEEALRTVGLIDSEGMVILIRSSFHEALKNHAVPGMGSRISLGGHSHPAGSGVEPSRTGRIGTPADVELFALKSIGLPDGFPINNDVPSLAVRQQEAIEAADEDSSAEAASNVPALPENNLGDMLDGAISRLEGFAGSNEGQASPLPIDELVLYLKVLRAMHDETVGKYEGSKADHRYVHTYRGEFAAELAHHPRFQEIVARMFEASEAGAFRILAEQFPGSMEDLSSLEEMVSMMSEFVEELSVHPSLRDSAIRIINDPRTYGLDDLVLGRRYSDPALPTVDAPRVPGSMKPRGRIMGLIGVIRDRLSGKTATAPTTEVSAPRTTALVTDSRSIAVFTKTSELAAVSDGLVAAAEKEKRHAGREQLKPSPEEVIRTRANRLLTLAEASVNDDSELAEASLREYLRLVKTFGDRVNFYVAVTSDKHENILSSPDLRATLIETVRSIPNEEDRNNMLTKISLQFIEEGDIQDALDTLEEIRGASFYTFSVALERLADLLIVPGQRNDQMIAQLERIVENVPVVTSRGRYDERKVNLFVKLGDRYHKLGISGKANSHYRKAWDAAGKAEQPAVTRLECCVPLMREKGISFPQGRKKVMEDVQLIAERNLKIDSSTGRPYSQTDYRNGNPNNMIALGREHAFNGEYDKAEAAAFFINENMSYPRDHYDHVYGAIIEAAALRGDDEKIGYAASKMTHYVKDHLERAAQLLVKQRQYEKAMELGNIAMRQGGTPSVGYWGSSQIRVAVSILARDSSQIELVRRYLGSAISRGIGEHDLERVIDLIAEYPELDPDGQFTLKTLNAAFERNRSIIKHKGHRVILKKLREIIMARVKSIDSSLLRITDVFREANHALPAPDDNAGGNETRSEVRAVASTNNLISVDSINYQQILNHPREVIFSIRAKDVIKLKDRNQLDSSDSNPVNELEELMILLKANKKVSLVIEDGLEFQYNPIIKQLRKHGSVYFRPDDPRLPQGVRKIHFSPQDDSYYPVLKDEDAHFAIYRGSFGTALLYDLHEGNLPGLRMINNKLYDPDGIHIGNVITTLHAAYIAVARAA